MKTFIIALFGLALLTSNGAWGQAKKNQREHRNDPSDRINVNSVCNKHMGIMVILIQKNGDVLVRPCKDVTHNFKRKNIRYEGSTVPPEYNVDLGVTEVGIVKKRGKEGDTDPCYEWTVGGESHVYCW